ncbi:prepilin-type N-terminal cleavage/methylation domain-containing protein [Candidatus Saccharibacteria bacterium]|nr:prepilin-type N-terminal cleavage/methylation domain-containing protein [Candidatus Saccharibacteria bacterium]
MYKVNSKLAGFTIIELLVVIVVIGIMAIIVIVSYSGIQNRATISSLKSDLSSASKLLSMDLVMNGAYPASLNDVSNGSGVPASPGTVYDNYYPTSTGFCITARRDTTSYRITNNSVARPGVCSGPNKDTFSLIKWNTWIVGSGGATNYSVNGDGNSRVLDTNPWGVSDVVWNVSNQDLASDADGGWNGANFNIDNTKKYRFSTFIRRKAIGNGSFYLGTHGYPDAVLNRSDGAASTNPYFSSRAWWGNVNDWYLVIGHIWPAGSGTGAATSDSGIYTMGGIKLFSNSDFVWQSTTTSSHHRSYLYYSTDVTTNQQWYQPRVDIIDGNEPSISELLNNSF